MPRQCMNCHAMNTDDARFCEGCGAPMQAGVPPVAQPSPPGPAYRQQTPSAGGQKPKKGGRVAVAVVLAVVLLVAIGTGVFLLLRGRGNPPVADSAPPASSLPQASSTTPASAVSSSFSEAASESVSQPDAPMAPVVTDPRELEVSLEDFDWYYEYEESSGIPPNAKVIGDDVSRLYGAWKGLVRYDFEFETLYHTWGVAIEPSDQSDASFAVYEKEASTPEGWENLGNALVETVECTFESNMLQFEINGVYMGLLFWEDGDQRYAVCHFQMDNGIPGIMMLTR